MESVTNICPNCNRRSFIGLSRSYRRVTTNPCTICLDYTPNQNIIELQEIEIIYEKK